MGDVAWANHGVHARFRQTAERVFKKRRRFGLVADVRVAHDAESEKRFGCGTGHVSKAKCTKKDAK